MNACRTFLGCRGQKEFTRIFEKRQKSEGSQNRTYCENLIAMAPSRYISTLLSGLMTISKSTGNNKVCSGEAVYLKGWIKYTFIVEKNPQSFSNGSCQASCASGVGVYHHFRQRLWIYVLHWHTASAHSTWWWITHLQPLGLLGLLLNTQSTQGILPSQSWQTDQRAKTSFT